MIISVIVVASFMGAVEIDLPPPIPPHKPETVYVDGFKREFTLPYWIMKANGIKPGATIPMSMAREIVEHLGFEYPDDILDKLEKLDRE